MRYKLVPTRQVPSLVRILTTRRNKITIMDYLDFNPSTSSLLRTRASDCANSPDDWEYPAVRAATFYGTCARAATYDERSVESSRLAQLVERKTLNLVVVDSSPKVGVFEFILPHTFGMFFCLLLFFVFISASATAVRISDPT